MMTNARAHRAVRRGVAVAQSARGRGDGLHATRWLLQGAALLSLSAGCLEVVGDVDIGVTDEGVEARPNKRGIQADGGACRDEASAAGACSIICSAGEGRCDGPLLQRCNERGDGWDPVDQCASHALCDATEMQCSAPACAPRQHFCSSAGELLLCKEDRSGFEHKAQCQSGAYCSAVSGREGCEAVACRAGRQRCNGAQIEECRSDRTGFDPVGEPCASASLCREGDSAVARCEAALCVAGRFECDGARLMRCADDANTLIEIRSCPTEQLCNAPGQGCDPPACAPGQRRCSGSVLERCNAGQTAFEPIAACASELLCDASAAACLTSPPAPIPPVLGSAPYTFVSAAGSSALGLGPLTLDIPAEWVDIDRRPWTNPQGEALGPQLIASTDAARFSSSFDIPGVLFAATARPPVNVAARLAEVDLSARCTRGEARDYDDGLYFGKSQTWTDCGSSKATNVVVAAVPKEEDFVAIVIVSMLAERDQEARRTIWDSFLVQPEAP